MPDLDHAPRVEQALLDGAPERRAVSVAVAEIAVIGVGMGVEMDEAERRHPSRARAGSAARSDGRRRRRAESRRPGERREEAPSMLASASIRSIGLTGASPTSAMRARSNGEIAGDVMDAAHQARLVADLARSVARAGAVGRAAVEGHADQRDVDLVAARAIGSRMKVDGRRSAAQRRRRPAGNGDAHARRSQAELSRTAAAISATWSAISHSPFSAEARSARASTPEAGTKPCGNGMAVVGREFRRSVLRHLAHIDEVRPQQQHQRGFEEAGMFELGAGKAVGKQPVERAAADEIPVFEPHGPACRRCRRGAARARPGRRPRPTARYSRSGR